MFDTMTLTKIVGALCGSLLILLLGSWAAEAIYHGGGHGEGHEQAYSIDTGEEEGEAEKTEEAGPDFAQLFASADPDKGERVFNKCKSCHSVEEGENRVGPSLYGVVGRKVDSIDGFAYSGALEKAADVWTPENLNHFLTKPSAFAPGTIMSFAGLGNVEDRANVIAFLDRTDGDTYQMDTAAADTAEKADEAPAEEAKAEAPAEESGDEQAATDETAGKDAGTTDEAAAEEPAKDETAAEAAPAEEPAEEAKAEEPASGDDQTASEEASAEAPKGDEGAAEEAKGEETAEKPKGDEAQSGFAAMVAAADPADGKKVFRQCQACHVADDETNRVGPHLLGVVGRDVASVADFSYSDALKEVGGKWTLDRLDHWLEKPRDFAPGNKMTYAGLRKEEDRAAVIAYLESLSK